MDTSVLRNFAMSLEDTFLYVYRALHQVPKVSTLEEYHCSTYMYMYMYIHASWESLDLCS